ncbi:MAG: phosphopentomutase [Candidatus Gastranaerophilales bacterium]|nr:phosphopentomutase [Candidatus Gastranaerophilales bacterium]
MKRAIIIVIDSMGIGAMPDCKEYNDVFECNTLKNVANFCGGLNLPNMQRLGLGNIQECAGVCLIANPIGQYGIMEEKSKGKDTTTGHWEIAGVVLDEPFAIFPDGFDNEIIYEFIEKTNCGAILGNYPASGTKIIEDLNEKHQKTKYPIIYTSADSVFQIAVDINVIPLETLYSWCEIARKILDNSKYNVSRVIARPYQIIDGKPTRISKDRRDYSLVPPKPTLLNEVQKTGGNVIAIGKIEDIFAKSGITHAVHIGCNKEGLELTLQAVKNELDLDKIKCISAPHPNPPPQGGRGQLPSKSLIFTNLVDTDMLYGHRNDAKGYGVALEEIDVYIGEILKNLKEDDLLVITADHGCDPTVEGTDHTREYVPVIFYHKNIEPKDLGLLIGFDNVASNVKEWLFK